MEAVPGDRIRISSEAMLRMMPMIAPIMHKVNVTFHHFFVPNRLTWKNWQGFTTGQDKAGNPTNPAPPKLAFEEILPSSLANYLGLPIINTLGVPQQFNALPFAAYERVFHDWYRDQNLQKEEPIELIDGIQTDLTIIARLKQLKKRAWEHDYFTSALPFTQKGDAVTLPISFDNAEITAEAPTGFNPLFRQSAGGTPAPGINPMRTNANGSPIDLSGNGVYYDPQGTLIIDGQPSTTIEDLRRASRLQEYLETQARSGNRFFEWLRSMFGVKNPDERLQRAEYLGGSTASMAISEVLQMSSSDGATPQGNMAGHGVSLTMGQDVNFFVPEHGYIVTIMNIQPKTAYMNGVPKHFRKDDKFDYLIPQFATLGEQPILQGELNYTGLKVFDDQVFGYAPIYADYRTLHSRVCGQMATTLDHWHMARKFDNTNPVPLNAEFIEADPTTRIYAVDSPNEDIIVGHIYNKIQAERALPKYGVPRL